MIPPWRPRMGCKCMALRCKRLTRGDRWGTGPREGRCCCTPCPCSWSRQSCRSSGCWRGTWWCQRCRKALRRRARIRRDRMRYPQGRRSRWHCHGRRCRASSRRGCIGPCRTGWPLGRRSGSHLAARRRSRSRLFRGYGLRKRCRWSRRPAMGHLQQLRTMPVRRCSSTCTVGCASNRSHRSSF